MARPTLTLPERLLQSMMVGQTLIANLPYGQVVDDCKSLAPERAIG